MDGSLGEVDEIGSAGNSRRLEICENPEPIDKIEKDERTAEKLNQIFCT